MDVNIVRKWMNLKRVLSSLLFLIFCVDVLCPVIILPLFPKIADVLHVSRVELRESIGCITAGVFSSQLTTGLILSKVRYKMVFMLLFLVLCLGSAISFAANNIYVFFCGEFIQGFGIGSAYPLINGLVNRFLPDDKDKVLSYIGSLPALLLFIGPIIGAQFYYQYHNVFFVIFVLGIAMFLLSLFIPSQHGDPNVHFYSSLMQLCKNKAYLAYMILRAFAYSGYYVFLAWVPFLIIKDLHFNQYQFSHFMVFPTVALFIGGISSNLMGDNHKRAMQVGGLLCVFAGGLLILFYCMHLFTAWSIFFEWNVMFFGLWIVICSHKPWHFFSGKRSRLKHCNDCIQSFS